METLCWFLRGLRHERQKRKRVCGKEHTERGPRSQVCEQAHAHTHICVHTQGGTGKVLLALDTDSDSKETTLVKDLLSSSSNHHPCLCFSVIPRLLRMSAWGFHWLFHTLLEEEEKKD